MGVWIFEDLEAVGKSMNIMFFTSPMPSRHLSGKGTHSGSPYRNRLDLLQIRIRQVHSAWLVGHCQALHVLSCVPEPEGAEEWEEEDYEAYEAQHGRKGREGRHDDF